MIRFLRTAPLLVAGSLLATSLGCSPDSQRAPTATGTKADLVVYAATSTRDALEALEAPYERDHGVDLVFRFASSGALSRQVVDGAEADVLFSADEEEMDRVLQARLVASDSRRSLFSNQLAVVEPADAPSIFTTPFAPSQLADARVRRISLGDLRTVPAGRYAKAWLEASGAWDAVSGRVLPAADVRAALAAVEAGDAEAGIVYTTEAARSKKVRVVLTVPVEDGPEISYPVAAIAGRPAEREAREFIGYLASPEGRKAFEARGFLFHPPATPSK